MIEIVGFQLVDRVFDLLLKAASPRDCIVLRVKGLLAQENSA